MVPYSLSQHPLSSWGKSIPKVKGLPGGIPFVLFATPYMFSPVCAVLAVMKASTLISLYSQKYLVLMIFFGFFVVNRLLNGELVAERLAVLCSEDRGVSLCNNTALYI